MSPWRRKAAPKRPRRRIRKLRFLTLLAALTLVALVAFTLGFVKAIASEIPELEPSARTERVERNGYIYASDGKTILAVLRGSEARVIVSSEDIAPVMKQAIVAVEDKRFFEHQGVDIRGMARAVWADIRSQDIVQGGSTITQQLVKNTYVKKERTVSRKLKEAALAWELERSWSKDRVLTAYLNTIYFGNGAYGIQMAARVYFGKKAEDLTLPEAALLAGIPANPAAYDPVANPDGARARRETVLGLMLEQDLINRADFLQARRATLPAAEDVKLPGTRGPAQHFTEYVKQQLISFYGSGKVFGGGLRVYTSIDLELQGLARKAIAEWLPDKDGPAAALVAVDPRDGSVLAMVGGNSFHNSQFNLAVQGQRQAGSAFKPFALAAALAQGISPQTAFVSEPTVINLGDQYWSVSNYEGTYRGVINLETATIESDNAVYAQLTEFVGPENVSRIANALGISSPLDDVFAISLGVEAVNPLEMVRAFSSLANHGSRVDSTLLGNTPRAVLRVVDGDKVDVNEPVDVPIIDENSSAIITAILNQTVVRGTGWRAILDDRPMAGKTGTTENYGDAWFVGYTPQLAVAIWVGYPNRLQPMLTEFEGEQVTGGTYPALIWKSFVESALEYLGEPVEFFRAPAYPYAESFRVAHRDGTWQLDNGICRQARAVVYFEGFQPKDQATCLENEVDVPTIVGTSLDQAKERLASMPLTPEVIIRPARAGEEPDVVVDQFPASGVLSTFDTIRVVVPEALYGTVPNVVGLKLWKARRRLSDVELKGVVQVYANGDKGVVLAQSPNAGKAAVPNMPVQLIVGKA